MKVDIFHIGPQKSATTWAYNCLNEHPEVLVADEDSIHYYDMNYEKGEKWYYGNFSDYTSSKKVIDFTPSYIRSTWAPKRIVQDNPDAKFVLCLRNPIDRAFSHYWHEKKKQKIAFEFHEVLENYDLYSSWIEPGLYAEHIERYLQYFDEEQFLFLKFNDLKQDPERFLQDILKFIEVDPKFRPTLLHEKANPAKGKHTILYKTWKSIRKLPVNTILEPYLRNLKFDNLANKTEEMPLLKKLINNKTEYEKGIPDELRNELIELIEPEIERLENLLNINLNSWRK